MSTIRRPVQNFWLALITMSVWMAPSVKIAAQNAQQAQVHIRNSEARLLVPRATSTTDATRVVGAYKLPEHAARLVRRSRAHDKPDSQFFADSRGDFYVFEKRVQAISGTSGVSAFKAASIQGPGNFPVRAFLERSASDSEAASYVPLAYNVAGTMVDTQPPALVSASLSPTSVDVTISAQTVDVEATLTDDESGLLIVFFYLDGPGETDELVGSATMVSGTPLNGLWQSSIFVPQYSTGGTWTLRVYAMDSAFNVLDLSTSETLNVAGGSDAGPPTVSGTPTLIPSAVDLSSGPQTVTAQARLLDDESGVWLVEMSLRLGQDAISNVATLISGDDLDGVWEATIEVPQNAAAGDWTLWISAWDNAQNTADINTGATLAVQGGDAVGPYLTGTVTLDPTSVAVADGDKTVRVTIPLADDETGVFAADVVYRMGLDEFWGGSATLISGDAFSGTWEAITTIPQSTAVGSWEALIVAEDAAFNLVELPTGVTLDVTSSDAQAPTLAGTVTVDPSSVNVSGGNQSVTVTAPVRDNLSGVLSVEVWLRKDFQQDYGGSLALLSGNALDGVWQGPVELYTGMESGAWEIIISASDSAFNSVDIASGVTIDVSGSDTQGPQLSGTPTVDPSSVNVTSGPGTILVSIPVIDGESGVESVDVRFERNLASMGQASAVLVAGTTNDGTWEATSTVQQQIENGDYQLVVTSRDVAGNETTHRTGQLLAVSGGDLAAPQLSGIVTMSTSEVNTADGPKEVTVTIPVSDAVSGVRQVRAFLMRDAAVLLEAAGSLSSGDVSSGIWTAVFSVDLPDATYDLGLSLVDEAGNAAEVATGLVLRVVLPPPGVVEGPRPFDGELQVVRRPTLSWSPTYAAREYEVYLWQEGEPKPASPLAIVVEPRFFVHADLGFGNAYNWQVLARNSSGEVSGPVWTFAVADAADLQVSQIQIPPSVQAGSVIQIQWTVTNQGQAATTAPSWRDRIYLSDDQQLDRLDTGLIDVLNLSFLGPGESYTNRVDVTLERRVFGSFYVLVETDGSSAQLETDESNNLRGAALQIDLPPAPDLQVATAATPSDAFSGSTITVQWTVENRGPGFTDVDEWRDRLFLSTSSSFNADSTLSLTTVTRRGVLAPDSSYEARVDVALPAAISGVHYLHVVTDVNDDVFEQAFESNNTRSNAVNVVLSPPPDLVVEDISVPDTGLSGRNVAVSWTVRNAGAGPAEGSWQDRVYLSSAPVFDEGTAIVLGAVSRLSNLDVDGNYRKQASVRLPDGVSGPFYLHVFADWKNDLFEHTFEDNNVASSTSFNVELSPWPDLVPSEVSVPSELTAGEEATAFWRTSNNGAGVANASWQDSLFISSSATWNRASALPVGAALISLDLGPGESRTSTGRIRLPEVVAGPYYIYVRSDAGNRVYEHTDEGNNAVRVGPIQVLPPLRPDLVTSSVSAPPTATAGQKATLGWTVTNQGQGVTRALGWFDRVFLSPDPDLDIATDEELERAGRREPLAAGSAYTRSVESRIPIHLSGEYYVIVVADAASFTQDSERSNNTSVSATPMMIEEYQAPDLAVVSVTAADSVDSGQPLLVSWTVENRGVGSTEGELGWVDRVYLSSDASIGWGDPVVAVATRTGVLEIGGQYTTTMEAQVPVYVSGPMYVIVETDSYRDVDELSDSNNVSQRAITAVSRPPADLVVSHVQADPSGVVGDDITVSWILRNEGLHPVDGRFSQGIYMSEDESWQLSDLFLGVHTDHIVLASGAQMKMSATFSLSGAHSADSTGTMTTALPGLKPGSYLGLVRADLRNNIRETVEDNNTGVASSPTVVDVPLLTPGIAIEGNWSAGDFRLYRIDVQAGVDLRLTLGAGRLAGNGLYVSYDRVPSPSAYDFANTSLSELSRELMVPSTSAGTYYVLATAQPTSASATEDSFSLLAEALSFSVSDVSPSRGGTPGRVTAAVRGAGFRADSEVRLRRSGQNDVIGELRQFVNTTELSVRWDLDRVPLGSYDVIVRNSDGSETSAVAAFEVETALPPKLEVIRNTPDQIRATRPNPYVFRFRNASNVDIDYAAIQIEMPWDADVRVTSTDGLMIRSMLMSEDEGVPAGSVEDYLVSGGLKFVPLVARSLGPGQQVEAQFSIAAAFDPGGEFPIRTIWKLMDRETFLEDQTAKYEMLRLHVLDNPSDYPADWVQLALDRSAFIRELLGGLVQVGMLAPEEVEEATAAASLRFEKQAEFRKVLTGGAGSVLDAAQSLSACNDFFRGLGCVITIIECIPETITVIGAAACGLGIAACIEPDVPKPLGCLGIGSALNCLAEELICNDLLAAIDPNDILGPNGYGDRRWTSASTPLGYTIRFENDPELATAPAQVVRVTEDLDSDLDARSFRLGAFGFAGFDFSVPRNVASFSGRLDVRDSLGIYVDVTAGVDVETSSIFWTFTSVDPVSGQLPADPLAGFLAVNDSLGRGEGYVTYTIRPVPDAATGDVVDAMARIVFDLNDPIDTPAIFNTLDALPPSSHVISATEAAPGLYDLLLSAQDDDGGAGIRELALYAAVGDSTFSPLETGIQGSSVAFAAGSADRYRFFSVATDHAGNVEAVKSAAEVVVSNEENDGREVPESFALYQSYPNPFNPTTTIPFDIPEPSDVQIKVFDVIGRLIRTYRLGGLRPGKYEHRINLVSMASGVYFYELRASGKKGLSFRDVRTVVLVK